MGGRGLLQTPPALEEPHMKVFGTGPGPYPFPVGPAPHPAILDNPVALGGPGFRHPTGSQQKALSCLRSPGWGSGWAGKPGGPLSVGPSASQAGGPIPAETGTLAVSQFCGTEEAQAREPRSSSAACSHRLAWDSPGPPAWTLEPPAALVALWGPGVLGQVSDRARLRSLSR